MYPTSEHPVDKHPYLGAAGDVESPERVRVVLPVPGSGERSIVEINGVDVANHIVGLALDADGRGNRRLTIHLPFDELRLDHCTRLSVPEWAHSVLVALGWTPPQNNDPRADTAAERNQR